MSDKRPRTWEQETKRGTKRVQQLLARRLRPTWRYGVNLGPTLAHWRHRKSLRPELSRVVRDLDRDGIAISTVNELVGPGALEELQAAARQLERERQRDIDSARDRADDRGDEGEKHFYLSLLGERPLLDPASPFVRFAVHPELRAVADAYYGMRTQLRDFNVWRHFATDAAPHTSQLWHRDWREDHLILKLFVYLSDVPDDGAGPFRYVKGTHAKRRLPVRPPGHIENLTLRSTDEELATVISPERWVSVTGQAGTLVLADTTGLHRGGWTRTQERLLYTCLYGSLARSRADRVTRPPGVSVDDPSLAFALNLTRSVR